MKLFKSIVYLLAFAAIFSLNSCSNDSEGGNPLEEGVDLIVGEWLFQSENDYECGTNNVVVERLASDNDYDQTFLFKSDFTYESYDDGILNDAEDQMGTWESLGDGLYRLNYTVFGEPRSETVEIQFIENGNAMRFGVDGECFEGNTVNLYTYTVWTRLP